jgi:hypothetical protein
MNEAGSCVSCLRAEARVALCSRRGFLQPRIDFKSEPIMLYLKNCFAAGLLFACLQVPLLAQTLPPIYTQTRLAFRELRLDRAGDQLRARIVNGAESVLQTLTTTDFLHLE